MRVFRYFPPEGGILSLDRKTLLWKDARTFNDPFELRPQVPDSPEELRNYLKAITTEFPEAERAQIDELAASESEGWERFRNRAVEAARTAATEGLAELCRILCCSFVNDSILMWSHYTDKHRGIVVEFDTDLLLDGVPFVHDIWEVNYRTNRVRFCFEHLVNEAVKSVYDGSMRTKSVCWSYEEEVRIILHATEFEKLGTKDLELPFKPLSVKSITLGANASSETKEAMAKLVEEKGYSHVKLGKAEIHPTDYKLVIR